MSVDPESLSKDKLKTELRKFGVVFNQNENKPYYVELYRSKLREQQSLRSEFSDDEEQFSRTPRGSKKVQKKKQPKSRFTNEVKDMTDATLRTMLIQYGENPGPITSTTRNVYESKLALLMEKSISPRKLSPRVQQKKSYEMVEEEEEEEVMEVSFVAQAEDELSDEDVPVQRKSQRKLHAKPRESGVVSSYNLRRRGQEPRDIVDSPSLTDQRSSPPRTRTAYSRRGQVNVCEIILKLGVLILTVAIAFLIYDHMTTPTGTKSIAIHTYEYLYPPNIMRLIKPETCASRVEEPGSSKKSPEISPEKSPEKAPEKASDKGDQETEPSMFLKDDEQQPSGSADPDPPRQEKKDPSPPPQTKEDLPKEKENPPTQEKEATPSPPPQEKEATRPPSQEKKATTTPSQEKEATPPSQADTPSAAEESNKPSSPEADKPSKAEETQQEQKKEEPKPNKKEEPSSSSQKEESPKKATSPPPTAAPTKEAKKDAKKEAKKAK